MSWLKLNDSFNTLKGQISNVSNVVQEVFSESLNDDGQTNASEIVKLEDANKKIDDLTNLCATQDVEISTLRRQIAELHQQHQQPNQHHQHQQQLQYAKNTDSNTTSTKSLSDNNNNNNNNNATTFEDSWFWESEQTTLSSKSSGSGGDLTTIPLDIVGASSSGVSGGTGNVAYSTNNSNNGEQTNTSILKYRKLIDEKDQKLKTILLENAILNEKVNQLVIENKEINENIDELDKQHGFAIERVLTIKNELQEKSNQLQCDLDRITEQQSNQEKLHANEIEHCRIAHTELISNHKKLQDSYERIEASYVTGVQTNIQLQNEIDQLKIDLENSIHKNVELSSTLIDKEKELSDKFELIDIVGGAGGTDDNKCNQQQEQQQQQQCNNCNNLQSDYQKLKEDYEKTLTNRETSVQNDVTKLYALEVEKRQIEATYIALQEDDLNLQREYHKLKEEYEKLLENHQSYEITDDHKKLLANKIYQLELEKLQIEQTFTALQEDDLNLQREHQQLKEDYEKVLANRRELVDQNDISKINEVDNEKRQNESVVAMVQQQDDLKLKQELETLKIEYEKLLANHQNYEITDDHKKLHENKIYQLELEKRQIEETYTALQEDDLNLQREHQQLKDDYKKLLENHELSERNDVSKIYQLELEKRQVEETLTALQEDDLNLQRELHTLKEDYEKLLLDNNKSEKIDKHLYDELKSDASENESKLVQENVLLQKQLIDLKSQLNNSNIDDNMPAATATTNIISIDNFKLLIKKCINNINIETIDDEKINEILSPAPSSSSSSSSSIEQYLNDIFKLLLEKLLNQCNKLEQDLFDQREELKVLLNENDNLKHERDTIQADLGHYENEVSELMKNNDILINELDNYKTNDNNCGVGSNNNGKLETISEYNEDQIITLERQLDDCNVLNQNLEDEYISICRRLDESDTEKEYVINRIKTLENELNVATEKCKTYEMQIENLESEKSNILFEINELKSDEWTKDNFNILQDKYNRLTADHTALVGEMKIYENNIKQQEIRADEIISQQNSVIMEKENLVRKKSNDVEQLIEEIHGLKTRIDNMENQTQGSETKLKIESDKIFKENNELQLELKQKYEENSLLQQSINDEQHKNLQYLDKIKNLNESIKNLQEQLLQLPTATTTPTTSTDNKLLNEENENLKKSIDSLVLEKNQLILLVKSKHDENINYHTEIQRLDQLLRIEVDKNTKKIENNCENCKMVNEKCAEQLKTNEKLNDQIEFLREKSDILTGNLLTEQTNQKLLQQEKQSVIDENNNLTKDLNRLRQHLIDIEDSHTQETVELHKIIDNTKQKMDSMENDAKKSSNAYTSASIRANQQTETLQTQYLLLQQQRDDISAKLSSAEDRESKNQASLINLQCALEQFQRDKERDVHATTQRLRKDLESEKLIQTQLHNEIQSINKQLSEAKQGLLAAARLSDQLELLQVTNANLKENLHTSQQKINNLEMKLHENETNQADKVEKCLLKNLLIGYIVSPNQTDKLQILKLISSVLDFNQNESDKVGLNRSHVGWLNSILGGHATTTITNESNNSDYNKEGLAQAFVKFLEKESQPKENLQNVPTLLNMMQPDQQQQQPPLPKIAKINENTNPGTISNSSINNINSNISSSSSIDGSYVTVVTSTSGNNDASATSTTSTTTSTITTKTTTTLSSSVPQSIPPSVAIQPILITSDSMLQNFMPHRNSSSILKDILNDS